MVALAGCPADDVDGVSTAEDRLRPLVASACSWMYGCCVEGELTYQLGAFTADADDCTERMIDAIRAGAPLGLVEPGLSDTQAQQLLVLARSINEGRVSVKGDAVEACSAATDARECNVPVMAGPTGRCTPVEVDDVDPCDPNEMFVGRQGVGEECEAAWECDPELRCIDFGIVGVCAAAARLDETCFDDAECARDLVCGYQGGTCLVGALTGEPCEYADPARPLPGTETTRCAAGLSCDPSTNTCAGGFCTPGAPCFDVVAHSDCPEATFCVGEPAGPTTCRTPGPVGAPCVDDLACESKFCDTLFNTCALRLADGAMCFNSTECQSDYCDFLSNLCQPQVAAGQPCPSGSSDQCANGYCDTGLIMPTCVAYVGEGGPCITGVECNPDDELVCAGMTCQRTPFPNGVMCGADPQCVSQVCFAGECVEGTPLGSPCDVLGNAIPRCVLGAFCDVPEGQTTGACVEVRRSGEACERTEQCWGECVVRYGQTICDSTPAFSLDEVWCDGA